MRELTDWMAESELAVAYALCAVFSLDETSTEAADFIRFTYRSNTQPQPPLTKDCCYITITESAAPPTDWIDFRQSTDDGTTTYQQRKTLPLNVLITFYGPKSAIYAEYAWSALLADYGYGSPREILRRYNIVPVPPLTRPVSVPEPEDGNWRKRSDVQMRANLLLTEDIAAIEPIESVELNVLTDTEKGS